MLRTRCRPVSNQAGWPPGQVDDTWLIILWMGLHPDYLSGLSNLFAFVFDSLHRYASIWLWLNLRLSSLFWILVRSQCFSVNWVYWDRHNTYKIVCGRVYLSKSWSPIQVLSGPLLHCRIAIWLTIVITMKNEGKPFDPLQWQIINSWTSQCQLSSDKNGSLADSDTSKW